MKYKIENHVIDAKSPTQALKAHKVVKSCKTIDGWTGQTGKTQYNYQVVDIYKGATGRLYVVVKRPNDYAVGAGYNPSRGDWDQGYYGFETAQKAMRFAEKHAREVGDSVKDELKFDRIAECDWCGKVGKVAVTHYGTSHYNRLICPACAAEMNVNDSIKDDDSHMIPSEIISRLTREGKWDDRTKVKYVGKVTINGKEQDKFIYGIPGGKTQYALYIKEGKFQGAAQQGSNIDLPDSACKDTKYQFPRLNNDDLAELKNYNLRFIKHVGEDTLVEGNLNDLKRYAKEYLDYELHPDYIQDNDIEFLSKEEEQAIEDYKKAIMNTNDVKLLKLFAHILKEETEHLEELQNEEVEDSKLKKK